MWHWIRDCEYPWFGSRGTVAEEIKERDAIACHHCLLLLSVTLQDRRQDEMAQMDELVRNQVTTDIIFILISHLTPLRRRLLCIAGEDSVD